jgi:hypothetical protein
MLKILNFVLLLPNSVVFCFLFAYYVQKYMVTEFPPPTFLMFSLEKYGSPYIPVYVVQWKFPLQYNSRLLFSNRQKVSQEEMSVFWEVIVSVTLSKLCTCTCAIFQTFSEKELFHCTIPKLLIIKRHYCFQYQYLLFK